MSVPPVARVTTRNASFQQWEALLTNRTKRHRLGSFVVQGVRPITLAVGHGWTVLALLVDADRPRSDWARGIIRDVRAAGGPGPTAMAGDLLSELGGKEDGTPEMLAVVATRPDVLLDPALADADLVVALDRPANPGNLGTVIRSADAFGASAVVVCGHSADIYDPRTVRASTGSLFSLPVGVAPNPAAALAPFPGHAIVGTDESGADDIDRTNLRGPTVLVVGNETTGLSAGWRQVCQRMVRIPIGGGASSLNAATAAGIGLYEAARQRRRDLTA